MADGFTKGLALVHILDGVLLNTIHHPEAESCHHQALVIEGRQQGVPGIVRLGKHLFIGDQDILKMHRAGTHGTHTQLGQRGDGDAGLFGRHPEQTDPLMTLFHILLSTGQHQQVIRHMGRRTPDLLAIENPAAIATYTLSAQGTEHIGTAIRLGKGNRCPQLARGNLRQEFFLLRIRTIDANGF